MRLAAYVILFVLVFVFAVASSFPLAFLLEQAKRSSYVSYDYASGTVWGGAVSGLQIGGQPLGEVKLRLKPLDLLAGRFTYDVTMHGEVADGKALASLGFGGGVRIANLIADVNVQKLARLDPRLRTQPSKMTLAVPSAEWNRAGDCRSLSGDLGSDLLTTVGRSYNWPGPALTGAFRCEGKDSLIELAGDNEIERIQAIGRVSGDGGYTVFANVETDNETLAIILETLEFRRSGGSYQYTKTNRPSETQGNEGT